LILFYISFKKIAFIPLEFRIQACNEAFISLRIGPSIVEAFVELEPSHLLGQVDLLSIAT
jgi:hypothetical protein